MVHGRFQPFHKGHLAYLLAAAARCDFLFAGITNPDPTHIRPEPADRERSTPEGNPFPYHLRCRMVWRAATGAGVSAERLVVVPFPIHQPDLWEHYVPEGTVHYLRILSPWGEVKRGRLEEAGYRVEVLTEIEHRDVTGTEVRRRLREGGSWRELVPEAVAQLLEEWC